MAYFINQEVETEILSIWPVLTHTLSGSQDSHQNFFHNTTAPSRVVLLVCLFDWGVRGGDLFIYLIYSLNIFLFNIFSELNS